MNYLLPDPTDRELVDAIAAATARAVADLFQAYPEHSFYYCVLVTTGEAHSPFLSAWSRQMLLEAAADGEEADDLKWSYVDSPACCFGEQHFSEVKALFERRPEIHADTPFWSLEYASRLNAMELALARVDASGVFGSGSERERIYVNVEVMPPDFSNVERALRLNPRGALVEWLQEAAELEPHD